MTIPWMMNCDHKGSGWCLSCVREMGEENQKLLNLVRYLSNDICMSCDKFQPHLDDAVVSGYVVPRDKEFCGIYLCDKNKCPHFSPNGVDLETVKE